MDVAKTQVARRSRLDAPYDAVVVGAGPYGLSTAAHLRGLGLDVAVFGKTLEMWRRHMPKGMLLRSHWWASNLSDPAGAYTFERFFSESRYRKGYPVPLEAFIDYGLWFRDHAVPDIDETYVTRIERRGDWFVLTLEDGRVVHSAAVVMAIGLRYYANEPEEFRDLPLEFVSHTCEHVDLTRFRGQRVVVVGGGQSAVEYAALLHEAGASVDLVSRRPIVWLARDRFGERGFVERMRAPDSGIGPGWKNWVLEHWPFLFYRLPQARKDHANAFYSGAWAAEWLRDRILGKVRLHEGRTVTKHEIVDGKVEVTLSDGEGIAADHVMLGTGYKVDIDKLPMIDSSLRPEVKAREGVPILSPSFQSSVPGLYFVGLSSWRTFGPLYRFVLGCQAAAPRVARSIARQRWARRHPGVSHTEDRERTAKRGPAEIASR